MEEYISADVQELLSNKLLSFKIGSETCGIEINAVTEILDAQGIRVIRGLPLYFKGVLNLRGIDIPVMDVRRRFRKEPAVFSDKTSVIIVELGDLSIGLIVDSVAGVLNVCAEYVLKRPEISADPISVCLKGIGKYENQIILILDTESLLTEDDIKTIGDVLGIA